MSTKPNTTRQQRYRAKNRRIDYAPSTAALEIILRHYARKELCLAGIIDELILAGGKAVSGNGRTP